MTFQLSRENLKLNASNTQPLHTQPPNLSRIMLIQSWEETMRRLLTAADLFGQ